MKIAKHCHEECASDVIIAQGALLGLVVEDRLEITNCFAFPKSVDESINDGQLLDMLFVIRILIEISTHSTDSRLLSFNDTIYIYA